MIEILLCLCLLFFIFLHYRKNEKKQSEILKALSYDIIQKNIDLFKNFFEQSAKDEINQRYKDLEKFLDPINFQLKRLDEQNIRIEKERSALSKQLESLIFSSEEWM